jgi:DNA-binding NarL/FixJ family response regulator
MTRLFVVDDHAVLRHGLQLLLEQEPDLLVVGEAANGQQLLDQLPTTPADLVLLDLHMPVLDGLATARRLRTDYPALRILMLSMVEEPLSIQQALTAGAHGYLLKNATKEEVVAATRLVAAGQLFLSAEIGLNLLRQAVNSPTVATAPASRATSALSHREREILQLIAEGLTAPQIAEQLFTSKRTVETHRQNILEKTGCKNTATLMGYAITHNLITVAGSTEHERTP